MQSPDGVCHGYIEKSCRVNFRQYGVLVLQQTARESMGNEPGYDGGFSES